MNIVKLSALFIVCCACFPNEDHLCHISEENKAENDKIEALIYAGQLDDAKQRVKRQIREDINNHIAYNNLGAIYYKQFKSSNNSDIPKIDSAILNYSRGHAICANNSTILGNLIQAYYVYHKDEKVLELGYKYVERFDTISAICTKLAYSHSELGDQDKAIYWAKKGIEIEPDCRLCYNILGMALYDLAKYEESLQHLYRSREIKPDNWLSTYSIANSLFMLGRKEEAKEEYYRAYLLDTSELQPSHALANIFKSHNQLDSACYYYKIALKNIDAFPTRATNHFFADTKELSQICEK